MYPVQNIRSLSFTSACRSTNTFIVYVARVPRITHALGQREVGGQNFVGPRRICQLEMTKFSRLDVWGRAQIVAYAKTGMAPATIATKVRKPGGGQPTPRAVRAVIQKARKNRTWRGARVHEGGRTRAMSQEDEEELYKIVVGQRGSARVTIAYCQKVCKQLRQYNRWVLGRALHRAGLRWLRRRVKSWVPPSKRQARRRYASWLLRQPKKLFRQFCYIDGTTFYLARTDDEADVQGQRRLGSHVWRMSSGKDGLYSDNVGPSLYASSQGRPVKIWGMLANGFISYHVLPADGSRTKHMNGERYRGLLRSKTTAWLRNSYGARVPRTRYLVHDHERCLYQKGSLSAARDLGWTVLTQHPKCSPDLNPIEGFWARLRQLLDDRAPQGMETRAAFLERLRRTVRWMNQNLTDDLKEMCTDLHIRAAAVRALRGAKTQF